MIMYKDQFELKTELPSALSHHTGMNTTHRVTAGITLSYYLITG